MKNIAAILCMDDDNTLKTGDPLKDANTFRIGAAGSFVTVEGTTDGFPRDIRAVVERLRPMIFQSLTALCASMDMTPPLMTSHTGCGALGLQDVKDAHAVAEVTKDCAAKEHMLYAGHIQPEPSQLCTTVHEEEVCFPSVIERLESDHNHHARGIIITVGGFISEDEITKAMTGNRTGHNEVQKASENILKQSTLGKYFILSMDWAADAIEQGADRNDVLGVLKFQVQVAHNIMKNTLHHLTHTETPEDVQLEILIHDGGRLSDKAQKNMELVQEALK